MIEGSSHIERIALARYEEVVWYAAKREISFDQAIASLVIKGLEQLELDNELGPYE